MAYGVALTFLKSDRTIGYALRMKWILVLLALMVACAPAVNNPTGPVLAVNIPAGPTLNITGARKLSSVPANLDAAVKRFYTSDSGLLEQPVLLENVTAASLEEAFRRNGVFMQSRWSYLGTELRTWPLGSVKRVVAVLLESERVAWLSVHRADLNAPFDGREIARRLAMLNPAFVVDAEKLGNGLGFRLENPTVVGFEYELRRVNKIDPNADDVFNFNIGGLQARYVKQRERRFPPSSGDALSAQLGSNPVVLLTKPRRTGLGPQLGLEVAGILGACSLESLSESEAGYDCDGWRFSVPVSR
jgi:hypothetical protein